LFAARCLKAGKYFLVREIASLWEEDLRPRTA
jgi:hypothetical protein